MKILLISQHFPDSRSIIYVWLRPLVEAIARLGNECVILCPYSIISQRSLQKRREFISFPGCTQIIVLRAGYFLTRNRQKVMFRALRRLNFNPDCVYGKFWKGAYWGYEYARDNLIPLFVDCGESNVAKTFGNGQDYEEFCRYVSGVICSSMKNRDECIRLGLASGDKCLVAVNGVNQEVFHKMDKGWCRRKLGIPQRDFVVVAVGLFNLRKGINRVAEALNRISDDEISALFIGDGKDVPHCDNIRFCGPVKHDDVPIYLNAADVFVLPSIAEGCSNAIIEAMACGLPIISSDLPFNADILDADNALLVDPLNIGEIAEAILALKRDSHKRNMMSSISLSRVRNMTLSSRAESICRFIENRI